MQHICVHMRFIDVNRQHNLCQRHINLIVSHISYLCCLLTKFILSVGKYSIMLVYRLFIIFILIIVVQSSCFILSCDCNLFVYKKDDEFAAVCIHVWRSIIYINVMQSTCMMLRRNAFVLFSHCTGHKFPEGAYCCFFLANHKGVVNTKFYESLFITSLNVTVE